jgi:hypothetical protein
MLYRYFAVLFLFGIILTGNLSLTHSVWAETLFESVVDTGLIVALRVGQAELQGCLPDPWQVFPPPAGPFKGANFFIAFSDRLLSLNPEGKPADGGIDRLVRLVVPAKHSQTGESALVVTRMYTGNPKKIPGPYKNSVHTTVRREQTLKGANVEAGAGDDFWEVRDTGGGIMDLRVQYQRALPSRAKVEQKVYSAVEPGFFRIYRIDQVTDVVKSIPGGIDRVQNYQLRVTMSELRKLFDGTEYLVAIAVLSSYVRQTFLP